MKPSIPHSLILISLLASAALVHGQTLDLGSNGSYGPLVVPANQQVTLQVPPDGVFHCTTIRIEDGNGTRLSFTKNAANTPVFLLATGDVYIGSKSPNMIPIIDVSGSNPSGSIGGMGGPGGFDGGHGGPNPGDGYGPGGGKGGWVDNSDSNKPAGMDYRGSAGFTNRPTHSSQVNSGGAAYGNTLLLPIIGGSGGGGGAASIPQNALGGGGGGGAIVIASNTKISMHPGGMAYIYALGAYGGISAPVGSGSGGSVRLVAPVIEGNLTLRLWPGNTNSAAYGGFGRARIDRLNKSGLTVTNEGAFTSYGSNMTVFPPNMPSLRITQVGAQVIPAAQATPVFVLFPTGSLATQTVSVSVTNFFSLAPLRAVITPESGSTQTFDFTVDNTAGGTTTGSVEVQIPAGVSSKVDVWTR